MESFSRFPKPPEASRVVIKAAWLDNLRHMLGAGDDIPKRKHGYRNRFAASTKSAAWYTMHDMAEAGLVTPGRTINDGNMQYFHATRAGCDAIGLNKAAIERAMEDA